MRKSLKIAVTGASGFLGSSTVQYFSQLSHIQEIRAHYSKKPDEKLASKIQVFCGDLGDPHVARSLLHGADVVFHFANKGFPADPGPNPTEYLRTNVALTGTLLDAMVLEKVRRIVFASSGGGLYRFDPTRRVSFHEGSEIEFRSAYGLTKFSIENLLLFYKRTTGLHPLILRISNAFGARQVSDRMQGFIGNLFSCIQKNEQIKIFGNLDIVKDFIYIDDLLRVFDYTLQQPDPEGIFNVGSGVGVSLREVITDVERVTKRRALLTFAPFNPSDCHWTVLNTSKIQKTLNWTCRHSVHDAIKLIWNQLTYEEPTHEEKKAA